MAVVVYEQLVSDMTVHITVPTDLVTVWASVSAELNMLNTVEGVDIDINGS